MTSELDQAIEAIQSGQKAQGLAILAKLVNQEPHNERAWLWLASCMDEPEKKRYCLQRVLELNPASAAARQLLTELDAPAAPPPQETTPESEIREAPSPGSSLRDRLVSGSASTEPRPSTETPRAEVETPKTSQFGEWGVVLTSGLLAGLIGLILALPLEYVALFVKANKTILWATYSVLWIGVGLIADYLLHLRRVSNKISRAVVGAPAGCLTSLALGLMAALFLNVLFVPHRGVLTPADSPVLDFITAFFVNSLPLAVTGMGLSILGALLMIGIIGAIQWVREPEKTEAGGK